MTTPTQVYDDLYTRVGTLLSAHTRIPDPRNLDQNNGQFLRKGYCLSVREGRNTDRELSCRVSVSRVYELKLTRSFYTRALDEVAREDTDQELLEDLQLVIDSFETTPNLTNGGIVRYLSDSGINSIFVEQENFVELTAILETEYFKSI